MRDVATDAIPTTITPEAAALANEYGVERELEAVLERGRQTVRGLRHVTVAVEPCYDTDSEDYLLIYADLDPSFRDDPSFRACYRWPVDHLPHPAWDRIRITSLLDETPRGR
jgi:hypothetical protein